MTTATRVTTAATVAEYPALPYAMIAQGILGARYELTLTFIGEARARRLNQTYRHKEYVPNVLSFPLGKEAGEIYICTTVAKREAPRYQHSYAEHVLFLFIHALLHLKGYDHGATMESLEQRYRRKYSAHVEASTS